MANTLISPSRYTPEDLYRLLASQVSHYHRHYHMGENTSVPAETAQALLWSIRYTLQAAGPGGSPPEALARGQTVLAGRLENAKQLHRLVTATESGQSSWFWDTLEALGRYLARYDHLHFAHWSPEPPCYPVALAVPEGMEGIDVVRLVPN